MAATLISHCKDIECGNCAAAIVRALGRADGVADVQVNVDEKQVTILYDEARLTPAMLYGRLELAGFKADEASE